jgi:hypothetical protein
LLKSFHDPTNAARVEVLWEIEKIVNNSKPAKGLVLVQERNSKKIHQFPSDPNGFEKVWKGQANLRWETSTSEDITLVSKVLGIEAARNMLIKKFRDYFVGMNLTIETTHIIFMADLMTYLGEVLGFTRNSMKHRTNHPFEKACLEKTGPILLEAAIENRRSPLSQFSERQCFGQMSRSGSNFSSILADPNHPSLNNFETNYYFYGDMDFKSTAQAAQDPICEEYVPEEVGQDFQIPDHFQKDPDSPKSPGKNRMIFHNDFSVYTLATD